MSFCERAFASCVAMRGVPFAGPFAASSESCPRPIFPSAAAVHASSKRRERRAVESAGDSEACERASRPLVVPFWKRLAALMNEPATANPPSDPRLKTLEGELSALTQQVQFLRAADSKKQTATACVALSLSSLFSLARPSRNPAPPAMGTFSPRRRARAAASSRSSASGSSAILSPPRSATRRARSRRSPPPAAAWAASSPEAGGAVARPFSEPAGAAAPV